MEFPGTRPANRLIPTAKLWKTNACEHPHVSALIFYFKVVISRTSIIYSVRSLEFLDLFISAVSIMWLVNCCWVLLLRAAVNTAFIPLVGAISHSFSSLLNKYFWHESSNIPVILSLLILAIWFSGNLRWVSYNHPVLVSLHFMFTFFLSDPLTMAPRMRGWTTKLDPRPSSATYTSVRPTRGRWAFLCSLWPRCRTFYLSMKNTGCITWSPTGDCWTLHFTPMTDLKTSNYSLK